MSVVRDILACGGFLGVLYGSYLVHPALAWICGGGSCVALAVLWSVRARK